MSDILEAFIAWQLVQSNRNRAATSQVDQEAMKLQLRMQWAALTPEQQTQVIADINEQKRREEAYLNSEEYRQAVARKNRRWWAWFALGLFGVLFCLHPFGFIIVVALLFQSHVMAIVVPLGVAVWIAFLIRKSIKEKSIKEKSIKEKSIEKPSGLHALDDQRRGGHC